MLDANDASLKQLFTSHIEKECFENLSHKAYTETMSVWPEHYVAQAYSRPINLFYLKPQLRARIEQQGELWQVVDSAINWDASSLQEEIKQHPERFSRMRSHVLCIRCILPNIAFVGGGGELAYWAQLKSLLMQRKLFFLF
ncbi:MAG: bacillithiol biosynthesis BshC [Bacteroidota bacterium]|nr:MAG: bacillithiol biosynthesis BshC [Bacteroidota bacterium]